MITVSCRHILYDDTLHFVESKDGTIEITVKGHAVPQEGQGNNRHALVCAAVSHAAVTLLRSLVMVADLRPDYTIDDGYLSLRVPLESMTEEKKQKAETIIESFLIGMLDLREKHGASISVTCSP